ncbi:MAG: hypothetical protein A2076_02240 [Geobacteraceae bacterium GWC2_53_11]|nr:MAG: hypothetical protein A2076_02240 [Geobacteraceae bacterium GWC2_53_11]
MAQITPGWMPGFRLMTVCTPRPIECAVVRKLPFIDNQLTGHRINGTLMTINAGLRLFIF